MKTSKGQTRSCIKMRWNGFIRILFKEFPQETCAFLFSRKPYSINEEWFVIPAKNVHSSPEIGWKPDGECIRRAQIIASNMNLIKIGNLHTHPCNANEDIEELLLPTDADLKGAKHYNDIIRGIIVNNEKEIFGIRFHDKFGNEIPIDIIHDFTITPKILRYSEAVFS